MKTCKNKNCEYPVFAKGYCKYHQYKRTDNRQGRSKQRSIKKHATAPGGALSSDIRAQWGFKSQAVLFKHIWDTRSHYCIFTNQSLRTIPDSKKHWCCAHVLPKGLYPHFKLNPQNIVLALPEFHTAVDNFTEDEREKHPDWDFNLFFSLQSAMKKKYNQFLKENL